ncbi:hypothetical protein TKK_0012104 [Trichogramma kaykai]
MTCAKLNAGLERAILSRDSNCGLSTIAEYSHNQRNNRQQRRDHLRDQIDGLKRKVEQLEVTLELLREKNDNWNKSDYHKSKTSKLLIVSLDAGVKK